MVVVHSSTGENKAKKICRRNSESNWSEILPELLYDVGKRLENRIDVNKFRSVCKNWRSSLPLPQNPNFLNPFLPLQVQIPNYNDLIFMGNKLTLIATAVFLVEPLHSISNDSKSKCWILSVEESEPGKFRVLYPLSGGYVSNNDPNFPKLLNVAEFRVFEIGKGCFFRVSDKIYNNPYSSPVGKVILSCNSAESGDCIAIVLFTAGTLMGLNLRDGCSKNNGNIPIPRFYDLLWLDGVVYAIDGVGRLYVINHMTLGVSNVIVKDMIGKSLGPIMLVESLGDVYLVALYRKMIYKLNRMECKWEEITTLRDRTVYVGCDACFMVPTQSLLGHDGDFILFNESMLDGYCLKDLGFYEAAKGLGMCMYCFRSGTSMDSELDLSYQAISSSLWPPPKWFW